VLGRPTEAPCWTGLDDRSPPHAPLRSSLEELLYHFVVRYVSCVLLKECPIFFPLAQPARDGGTGRLRALNERQCIRRCHRRT
ncbi:MAG: hypothetical protein WCD63_10175, partial [Terrimicrobiaceae bacterium]